MITRNLGASHENIMVALLVTGLLQLLFQGEYLWRLIYQGSQYLYVSLKTRNEKCRKKGTSFLCFLTLTKTVQLKTQLFFATFDKIYL